ncbi:DUF445 domain-containing protein [Paenibacillus koleovorans]|uniref:DUF445 domain-containing protein n=1 Tax=Paenibacillus koleovorans TaxID=121608 RepID=UPI000FD829B7|nr:DUF445 domain-containing protein [Paenibacillus koleovorans]
MNSRYLAGFSLAFMAAGFLVTLFLPENTATFLLKGGFEAGLVGGIADWFAVTALFRHPLGIPIPHTSLLLKNKQRIVQSLISATENELLNKKSIEQQLRKLQPLRLAGAQLTRLMGLKRVRLALLEQATDIVRRLPLEKLAPSVQAGLAAYVRQADVKQAAEKLVEHAMRGGYDERAFDYALTEASRWASRQDTQAMLGKLANEKLAEVKMGGLMGFAFQAFVGFMDEEKLGVMLQGLIVSAIRDLMQQDNPHRESIIREIRIRLFQLADDEARMDQLKEGAVRLLEGETGEKFLLARLEELRALVLDKLEEARADGGRIIFTAYRSVMRGLNEEPERIAPWENRLLAHVIGWVENNHYRIGRLIQSNVDQMDDSALVRLIEEKIGKDLQWIRVNGALCGFAVGLILSIIQL